jgi:hypothetical protein
VNLATRLLHDAHIGRFEVAVVVSNDSIQAQRWAKNVRLAGRSCVETASIRRLRVLRGRNRCSTAPPASNQVATVSYFCSHSADARCAPCAAAVLVRSGGSSASSASTLAKGEMLSGWSGPSPSVSATWSNPNGGGGRMQH